MRLNRCVEITRYRARLLAAIQRWSHGASVAPGIEADAPGPVIDRAILENLEGVLGEAGCPATTF